MKRRRHSGHTLVMWKKRKAQREEPPARRPKASPELLLLRKTFFFSLPLNYFYSLSVQCRSYSNEVTVSLALSLFARIFF